MKEYKEQNNIIFELKKVYNDDIKKETNDIQNFINEQNEIYKKHNKCLVDKKNTYSEFGKTDNDVIFFARSFNYEIIWETTHKCNYNCSYCAERLTEEEDKRKKTFAKEEIILQRAQKLNDFITENKKSTSLVISGGEPTLYDLSKVLTIFKDNKYLSCFTIITNGWRNEQYFKNIVDLFKNKYVGVSFNFSVHEEFTDIEKLIKKASAIKEYASQILIDKKFYNIYCSMVKTMTNGEYCDLAKKYAKENNIEISFQPNRE